MIKESMKVGLYMNFKKYIQNISVLIKIEKEAIGHMNNYVYLGQQVSTNPSMEDKIKRIIRIGWQVFGRASSIFNLSMQQKISV